MNRNVLLLVLCLACARGLGAGANGLPANEPLVVLRGERDSELGPHGQGNVYAPDVLLEGNRYRMWYGGQGKDGHDRIHYAESQDGYVWVRKGVVLEDRKANHVNDPCVVKVGGVYFMYYTRAASDIVDGINVAVSKDGIAWLPKGVALAAGQAGAWDSLSVGRPSVIHENGVFKLWYDGRKDFPTDAPVKDAPKSSTSRRSVGYATSKDGLRFVRHRTDPVFGNDAGGVDVKRVDSRLIMVYESRDGTRVASSRDGIAWKDDGWLVRKSGTIDAFGHVTPDLLIDPDGEVRRLYIGAATAATWDRNVIAVLKIPSVRVFSREADRMFTAKDATCASNSWQTAHKTCR